MTWRVIVGTLSVVGTLLLFGLVAVTEQDRMADFERSYDGRQVENGAAIFASNCQICHGETGQGVPGKGPALNTPDLLVAAVGAAQPARLQAIGWAGSVENFVRTTIAGGRPRASADYLEFPERMPTWGEEYGGPLRKDQVDALVTFIVNWRWNYLDASGQPLIPTATPIPDPLTQDITIALPAGDATRGADLVKTYACTACHIDAPTGPAWLASASPDGKGVGTHAEERIADPNYTGNAATAEQYLLESIILPNAYLVPGETYVVASTGNSIMPVIYLNTLGQQTAADIIAYLLTLK
jgi:mono/diheme cytochrome c family protein